MDDRAISSGPSPDWAHSSDRSRGLRSGRERPPFYNTNERGRKPETFLPLTLFFFVIFSFSCLGSLCFCFLDCFSRAESPEEIRDGLT